MLYNNLLTSVKLNSGFAYNEEQEQKLFARLLMEYDEKESITEQLKAADQMAWVRQMNNIRSRVTEVVSKELIYT